MVQVHNFSAHAPCLSIAQNLWVLFYTNPQGRCGGQCFFPCNCEYTLIETSQNCLPIRRFFSNNLADFPILFFTYFEFFSDIKRVQYRAKVLITSKRYLLLKKLLPNRVKQEKNNAYEIHAYSFKLDFATEHREKYQDQGLSKNRFRLNCR